MTSKASTSQWYTGCVKKNIKSPFWCVLKIYWDLVHIRTIFPQIFWSLVYMFFYLGAGWGEGGAEEDDVKISFGGLGCVLHNYKSRFFLDKYIVLYYEKDHPTRNGGSQSTKHCYLCCKIYFILSTIKSWVNFYLTVLAKQKCFGLKRLNR